jgi:hypothetical protein
MKKSCAHRLLLVYSSVTPVRSIALAGVASEYLRYGRAEGGLGDVSQLDGLLKALQVRQLGSKFPVLHVG